MCPGCGWFFAGLLVGFAGLWVGVAGLLVGFAGLLMGLAGLWVGVAGLWVGVVGLWAGLVRSILSKSLFMDRWECIIFVLYHSLTTNRNPI